MVLSENSLRQIGVTPTNESKRLRRLTPPEQQSELRQNLEAYTNEVLSDRPVSILYHYWPDKKGRLYTNPSLGHVFEADSQFDPQERQGYPLKGFSYLKTLLIHNQNNIVLWYSPLGPAAFDNDQGNPYSQINYDYGQLYIQYFDGEKINAVALKITNESVIEQFSPYLASNVSKKYKDQKTKIIKLLTTPIPTSLTIDDLFNHQYQDQVVYKDKGGNDHSLFEILETMKSTFTGEIPLPVKTDIDNLSFKPTENDVTNIYLQAIYNYQKSTGKDTISLSGSCGGSVAEISDIEDMLGIRTNLGQNPVADIIGLFSSARRLLEAKSKKSEDIFECPKCHIKINTKNHGPIGDQCPNCQITAQEAINNGLIKTKCA